MLFTSTPILRTDNSGPVAGTLIMARLLSKELVDKISTKQYI